MNKTMIERCMQCGRCSASCPTAAEMDIPPHKWVYRARNGDAESLGQCGAIWQCLSCFCCEARCPRGVKPAHLAEEARIQSKFTSDDIPLLTDEKMPQQLLVAALRKAR
ncbi:MAG: 4Fe-4S dicluster domain-containing protein [Defluviitaleaceae bacterium]|nr:4Fe-4S dicluster domain-containing protein [Defluviitaleaceae bacterium]